MLRLILATSFIAFAACSPTGPCTECEGCCDSSGVCRSGSEPTGCGANGVMCDVCSSGEVCSLGRCFMSSGTGGGDGPIGGGGGSLGGGGGTTGGGGGALGGGGGTTGGGGGALGGGGGATGGGGGGATGGGGGGATGGGGGGATGGGGGGATGGGSTGGGGGTTGGGSGADAGTLGCAGTLSECGTRCVDFDADPENCGTCGRLCGGGQVCNRGTCQVLPMDCTVMSAECGAGFYCDPISRACMQGCRLTADCPAGATCNSGTCGCPSGQHACGRQCVPNNSISSCGTACAACPSVPNGTPTCSAGACSRICDVGYVQNNGVCVDLNECSTNNGGCSASATCTNTPGSRTCACNTGFTGDGVSCTDLNECLTNNGGCDANATCGNISGSRTCACNTGFSGNGLSCADVNECLTNNGGCSTDATCNNTPGARTCTCNGGYQGSGVACSDINECTSNNGGCASNATCMNTLGSRTCTCDPGYSGTGLVCMDVNECLVNNGGCSTNGACTNTAGSRTCACNTGFLGSGLVCETNAYLKATNTGAGDAFGQVAVSADGLTLAIGAPREQSLATGVNGDQSSNGSNNSGAVYIYTRVGSAWVFQAFLKASNNDVNRGGRFGSRVTLSADGNTLAVGAVEENNSTPGINGVQWVTPLTAVGSGAVFLFTRSGTTWTQQAYIKSSNPQALDEFGLSVALSADGNTLAVGSSEDSNATGINGNQADNSAGGAGAVYVFTRAGTTWTQQAYVKASNTGANDHFGYSVALSGNGNTMVVGAILEESSATGVDGNQASNTSSSGAVYVFGRVGTVWTQRNYIKASNTGLLDYFGASVALSFDGTTLAVAAHGESSSAAGINGNQADDSASDSGAVYVFTASGSTWTQQAYVKASNPGVGDWFGFALALSSDGSTLAVGATREDSAATDLGGNQADNTAVDSGAAYVFTRSGTTWSQHSYVKATNTQANDLFGADLTMSGNARTLVVGALGEDSNATGMNGNLADNSSTYSGAAYIFLR